MKTNCIFQNNLVRRVYWFYILLISLISGLIEDAILISTSVFNLFCYIILVETNRKSSLIYICNWKKKKHFNSLKIIVKTHL